MALAKAKEVVSSNPVVVYRYLSALRVGVCEMDLILEGC